MKQLFQLFILCHMLCLYGNVDIKGGFGNVYPDYSGVIQIRVNIVNNKNATTGRILVYQPSSQEGYEVTNIFPFTLPKNSKKKFVHNVLCDPLSERQHMKVKVQFDDKRPEVMQKLNRSNEEPIIACYNIPKKYLTYKLKGKEAKEYLKENIRTKNIPLNSKLIPVTKSDLPENSLAYEGLYALFLNALDIDKLSLKQKQAIREWIQTGGRLLLYNPDKNPACKKFFNSMVSSGSLPSHGLFHYGNGLILLHTPKNKKLKPVWFDKKFLKNSKSFFQNLGSKRGDPGSGILKGILAGKSNDVNYSGLFLLVFIILIYILIIGPLDYYILKKTKKYWLTWVIFISAIIVFSGVSYRYSSLSHAGENKTLVVNFLDTLPGTDMIAKGNSIIVIYSTLNKNYIFSSEKDKLVFTAMEKWPTTSATSTITQAKGAINVKSKIPVFSHKQYIGIWHEKISINVKELASGYQINSDKTITEAILATDDGITNLLYINNVWQNKGDMTSWNDLAMKFDNAIINQEKKLQEYIYQIPFFDKFKGESSAALDNSPNAIEMRLSMNQEISAGKKVLFLKVKESLIEYDSTDFHNKKEINVIRIILK
ncbi:MAG: hypothetical protein HRT89_22015 [Lentisphaeria bacterium]|nr:hypothetical protein [Lentisphaeria bacterium]NQZ70739.1 hypothetical protein [Lentisphaeria bacterium]